MPGQCDMTTPLYRLLGVRPVVSSLSASLVTVSQSAPDLSLIFLESLEYFIELYLVNCILELLLSILSKRFRCSNESNQKAIRDRSSKVELLKLQNSGQFSDESVRIKV
jgi:hypothetical protein